MRKIFNFISFLLGVSILVVMIVFGVKDIGNNYCFISDITIEMDENKFVTEELIVEYLKANTLYPDSIILDVISFKSIEELLLNHPSIRTSRVYSDMKGNVFINVKQRKPIVRIQNEKEGYYLDEDGSRMPLSEEYTARMLLVTGEINSVTEQHLFTLTNIIFKDDFLRNQIAQISITDSELFILCRKGENIEFGKIKDINKKFEKLLMYYAKGNPQGKKYKTINLKYNNQIVCK